MAIHNDIVRELDAARRTIAALSHAEDSPPPTTDEIRAQLARLDALIERMSQPNPDSDGFYWWLIAVGINTKWVEDGVDFTDVRAYTSSPAVLEGAAPVHRLSDQAVPSLRAVMSRYEMRDQDEVRSHLARRPLLGAILADAADELHRYFGQTKLTLLARDDERLVVAVDTDLEVDEAETKLAAFRREWWQHKIDVEDRTAVKLRFV